MTDRRSAAILLLLQLAIVAAVDPRGNFPVNDDWAFAHSVPWMLDEGRMRISGWAAMNLLPQTVAGALAAALFGFSFVVLRHLTQCVAVLALLGAYAWFRAARFDTRDALVATVVVAAFPAWAVLSNSYMTDLYGAALAWPSAALFVRALDRPAAGTLLLATLLAAAGTLERQVVLVIPFAFMVAMFWTRRPLTASAAAIGIAPFACTLAVALAYYSYLVHGPGVPAAQLETNQRLVQMTIDTLTTLHGATWALNNAVTMIGYFGLFAAGWMLWCAPPANTLGRVALAVAGVVSLATVAFGYFPPYLPNNVMDGAGIGPFMLYDATRGIAPLDRSPGVLWRVAGVVAPFCGACLLILVARAIADAVRARRGADPQRVFILAFLAAYLAPFVVTAYFDRYLLFALPFVIALWTRGAAAPHSAHRLRSAAALAWIAFALALGAAATHDYFAWNRSRWDAIHMAERLGGTVTTIDGGFEYNGFGHFEIEPVTLEGKSWYWVRDDVWVVAFSNVPGYDEVRSFRVKRWLPRTPAEVKLLRRRS